MKNVFFSEPQIVIYNRPSKPLERNETKTLQEAFAFYSRSSLIGVRLEVGDPSAGGPAELLSCRSKGRGAGQLEVKQSKHL